MRNSNLVVRLSDSERQIVDKLQEEHSVNISQYVRNRLIDLSGIFSGTEGNNIGGLSIPLGSDTRQKLKTLREDFHLDPIRVLSDALDDDIIKDAIKTNILAIHDYYKNKATKI